MQVRPQGRERSKAVVIPTLPIGVPVPTCFCETEILQPFAVCTKDNVSLSPVVARGGGAGVHAKPPECSLQRGHRPPSKLAHPTAICAHCLIPLSIVDPLDFMTLKVDLSVPAVRTLTRKGRKSRLRLLEGDDDDYRKGTYTFYLILHLNGGSNPKSSIQIVARLFRTGWLHKNKNLPHVHRIFQIETPESLVHPYLQY